MGRVVAGRRCRVLPALWWGGGHFGRGMLFYLERQNKPNIINNQNGTTIEIEHLGRCFCATEDCSEHRMDIDGIKERSKSEEPED